MKIILEYDNDRVVINTKDSKMDVFASSLQKVVYLMFEVEDGLIPIVELKSTGQGFSIDDEEGFKKFRDFADEIVRRWNECDTKK